MNLLGMGVAHWSVKSKVKCNEWTSASVHLSKILFDFGSHLALWSHFEVGRLSPSASLKIFPSFHLLKGLDCGSYAIISPNLNIVRLFNFFYWFLLIFLIICRCFNYEVWYSQNTSGRSLLKTIHIRIWYNNNSL